MKWNRHHHGNISAQVPCPGEGGKDRSQERDKAASPAIFIKVDDCLQWTIIDIRSSKRMKTGPLSETGLADMRAA